MLCLIDLQELWHRDPIDFENCLRMYIHVNTCVHRCGQFGQTYDSLTCNVSNFTYDMTFLHVTMT